MSANDEQWQEIVRRVARASADLDDAQKRIDLARPETERARADHASARERLTEAVRLSGQFGDLEAEQRGELVRVLYWSELSVRADVIARAFSLKQSDLARIAGPIKIGACARCGGDIIARTRSESRLGELGVCRACNEAEIAARNEAIHAEWRREREEWEARETRHRARVQELRAMPYQDYLQTPEWRDQRHQALKRARYRCQVCNHDEVTLNVHQRTYVRLGEEDPHDLVVLCRDWHRLYHQQGRLPREPGT